MYVCSTPLVPPSLYAVDAVVVQDTHGKAADGIIAVSCLVQPAREQRFTPVVKIMI